MVRVFDKEAFHEGVEHAMTLWKITCNFCDWETTNTQWVTVCWKRNVYNVQILKSFSRCLLKYAKRAGRFGMAVKPVHEKAYE